MTIKDLTLLRPIQTAARFLWAMVLALAVTTLLAGCVTQDTQKLDPQVTRYIPSDANRVVLEVDPSLPQATDVTKKSLFGNTIVTLADRGYDMAVADYDAYVLSTQAKQIRDGLAVKIDLNVVGTKFDQDPQLIAAAQWAPTSTMPETLWREATWTDGRAKAAFAEVVDALADVQDTILYAETELGVAEKEGR